MSAETELQNGGLSLRALYALIVVVVLIFAGLQAYSAHRLASSLQRMTEASENQISLSNAAHGLMDASDYLTEQVQRFTADGDIRFLDGYLTEAFETNRREQAIATMSENPDSVSALARLEQAMDDSVELMDREYYAMRLVADAKGYTDIPEVLQNVQLDERDSALAPEDKMRRATKMVLDDEYYNRKERIRSEMQKSLDELESLTRASESHAIADFRTALNFVYVITVLQTLVMLIVIVLTVRLSVNPTLSAVKQIKADKPIRERGAREFRHLARAYNGLTEKLNRENELLKSISQTDALTGIRNRMALRNDYESYRGQTVTVMLLDLDKFKSINDVYGHDEGDRALRETGKLLANAFGKEHCYRFGGDEFLVIDSTLTELAFQEKLDAIMNERPILTKDGTTVRVGYSVGYVHATLDETQDLRDLFAEADQRMYKMKRGKLRPDTPAGEPDGSAIWSGASIGGSKYTPTEMRSLLDSASETYDLARVVDPIECRILEIAPDGTISRKERCYGIWNAEQKCVNCTSAMACRTGRHQEKKESYDDQIYHIQSNPVKLALPDGGSYDAVVELVHIEKESQDAHATNDRAAENAGHRADRYHAQHDSLTKALNPNAFSELSREAIAKNPKSPWTMITGNIMDFRLINTLFGSQRGNEAIVRTAAVLRQIAQADNGLCGRLGGDQFGILIPSSMYHEEQLAQAARILADEFSSGLYTFCIHFGVYAVENSSMPISVMCDRANTALRTIHKDLRECVAYFDDAMMKESLFAQEVISGFESALAEGQFQMHLQPLAREDGRILGAEALVRWHRPNGEITMPSDFIETLEHAGLIHKLDMFIWECAVRQLSAWSGTPREGFTISVNMSAKDFYYIDVHEVLMNLVRKYRVPSEKLKVEITETALLEDPEKSCQMIAQLRKEGFIVEIDDFGKGHSSLSLLKDINADVLKIDMSLLSEIECKQRNQTILESIVNMAASLGMDVVVEGVETEAQLQLLTSMGCHYFQGFYFSRPISIADFETRYTGAE